MRAYGPLLKGIKGARMITLSMPSRQLGELKIAEKELWDAFTRLRHRKIWKLVRGAVAVLEVTFNSQIQAWHPHLHVVVDSEFISWNNLRDEWGEVTRGLGKAVYIQKCRRGWHRELIKYITKVSDLLQDVEACREFLMWSRKRRFIRTYGTLYNQVVEHEESQYAIICSGCGAVMKLVKEHCTIKDVYGEEVNFVIDSRAGPVPVVHRDTSGVMERIYA